MPVNSSYRSLVDRSSDTCALGMTRWIIRIGTWPSSFALTARAAAAAFARLNGGFLGGALRLGAAALVGADRGAPAAAGLARGGLSACRSRGARKPTTTATTIKAAENLSRCGTVCPLAFLHAVRKKPSKALLPVTAIMYSREHRSETCLSESCKNGVTVLRARRSRHRRG